MCQLLPLPGPPLHVYSQGELVSEAYCVFGFELGGGDRTNEERELKKQLHPGSHGNPRPMVDAHIYKQIFTIITIIYQMFTMCLQRLI